MSSSRRRPGSIIRALRLARARPAGATHRGRMPRPMPCALRPHPRRRPGDSRTHLARRCPRQGCAVTRTYGSSETSGGCVYDGVPIGNTEVANRRRSRRARGQRARRGLSRRPAPHRLRVPRADGNAGTARTTRARCTDGLLGDHGAHRRRHHLRRHQGLARRGRGGGA